jgi:hypothetical protein
LYQAEQVSACLPCGRLTQAKAEKIKDKQTKGKQTEACSTKTGA